MNCNKEKITKSHTVFSPLFFNFGDTGNWVMLQLHFKWCLWIPSMLICRSSNLRWEISDRSFLLWMAHSHWDTWPLFGDFLPCRHWWFCSLPLTSFARIYSTSKLIFLLNVCIDIGKNYSDKLVGNLLFTIWTEFRIKFMLNKFQIYIWRL